MNQESKVLTMQEFKSSKNLIIGKYKNVWNLNIKKHIF